jgi:hypothetical protein
MLELIGASLVAAVGFVIAFSVGVFGFIKYSELQQDHRGAAVSHALLGVAGFAVAIAGVTLGIYQIAF